MRYEGREPELLLYIQVSIARIERYRAGGRVVFLAETMVQDAILWRLQTLADAASHLSTELKARHPEIRWRAIYGFRNVAAHGNVELDLDRVWEVTEVHLPPLRNVVDEEIRRGGLQGQP